MPLDMQHVNWVDWAILGLIGFSVLMGLWRGFVREAMSLITWLAALIVGFRYTEQLAGMFSSISMIGLRYLLAFILLVLAVLILGGIVGHLITRLITFTGFGATDRIMGIIFGLIRGGVVIAAVIMFFSPTPLSKDPLWTASTLIPRFTPLADWIKDCIPQEFIKKLQFEPKEASFFTSKQ